MVEASTCRMRLYKWYEISGAILGSLPSHVKACEPSLLRLHITGKPADVAAFSEISAPTNVIDVAAAVAIETISSAAGDNLTAGADVQKIRAICIQNDLLDNVDLSMDPTDGTTFVLHTELLKEVFHSFSIAWGTNDKDAAGNIDIRNIADSVFVQIAAAKNESNGARFKVPDSCVAMLYGGMLRRLTSSGAWANDEGIKIRIIYIDDIDGATGLVAADRCQNWLEFVIAGQYGEQELEIPKGFMFKSGSWVVFQHSSAVDAGEDYDLLLDFLVWKK